MKKIFTLIVISTLTLVFFACQTKPFLSKISSDTEIWAVIVPALVEGAEISDTRPAPDILSEKEILIKCAKIAVEEGYLDPNNLIYTRDQPKLLTAHIETPILIYDLSDPLEYVQQPGSYLITAVDNNGESLLDVFVNPSIHTVENGHEYSPIRITDTRDSSDLSRHYITKHEAQELIESQFPGQHYKGPTAIRMEFEGDRYSKHYFSWYFTVSDSAARSGTGGTSEEYLISALVFGYRALPAKLTAPASRSALDARTSLSGFTFYSRMVKLVEPVYFFDRLRNTQAGRPLSEPVPPSRVSPVWLQ
ncbi:hypothetical protein FACS1894172_18820 [Spirochaetia bacterium]|nr:hypothetical protein FACS1894164_14090 [Spirochaetia bacterium]GHU36188.1 hypothetical protein FACS1894172_18820 [Spirochaetia bacterium]